MTTNPRCSDCQAGDVVASGQGHGPIDHPGRECEPIPSNIGMWDEPFLGRIVRRERGTEFIEEDLGEYQRGSAYGEGRDAVSYLFQIGVIHKCANSSSE